MAVHLIYNTTLRCSVFVVWFLAFQKGGFCNVKTTFLHAKNHTFAWRICNMQRMNTLRTFRDHPTNILQNVQRTPTKCVANTPQGVGADSSRPYPNIIKCTYSFHHTRILTLSNTHIHFTTHVFSHY